MSSNSHSLAQVHESRKMTYPTPLLLPSQGQPPVKRKRNQPGNPDPEAEVVALSPNTLMATNRFLCEICGKGFQRDQNLQLHLRGHNLPWKLKQREENGLTRKKVYVCPEATCTHHHPSRALGDLTGIKKHFWRKHGEKRWTCTKCSKKYAVMSDWKAHAKTCGTREYKCSCGTIFSRKDSFATHRSFCEALAEESAKFNASLLPMSAEASPDQVPQLSSNHLLQHHHNPHLSEPQNFSFSACPFPYSDPIPNPNLVPSHQNSHMGLFGSPPMFHQTHQIPTPFLSATALLQEAEAGGTRLTMGGLFPWQREESQLTRDFLGVTGESELDLLSMIESSGLGHGLPNFMVSSQPQPWTAQIRDHHQRFP